MRTDEERQREFYRAQDRRSAEDRARNESRNQQARAESWANSRERKERKRINRINSSARNRNRALLLAASKRLRRIYFWGSTILLFVVSPILFFAPRLLGRYFEPSGWLVMTQLVLLFLGAIVVPLCALPGYFVWVRSNWYRWIGKGIKEDYDEGDLL